MKLGKTILLIGVILLLVGLVGGAGAILVYENSIIEYPLDEFFLTLSPDETRTQEFDFSEEDEVYFYFDYYPRGSPLKIVISNSEGSVIIDKTTYSPLLDSPFKSSSGIYLLEITNTGNDNVEIYDIGYQKPPLNTDENGNFILPSATLYSDIFENLIQFGIIVIVIGGIIFGIQRMKTKKASHD
jgi:hypothetical protein